MPEQNTALHHLEDLPSPAELWPDEVLERALDRMLSQLDTVLAELHRRPPWW
jgi:hypothetical protein